MKVTPNLYTDPFLYGINPYVRLALYDVMPAHYYLRKRIIYDYEIVLIKSGMADITVDEVVYQVQRGDVFLFKPGHVHSFLVHDKPLVQTHVHFDLVYSPEDSSQIPISFKMKQEMTEEERGWIRPDLTTRFFDSFPNHIRLQNPLYIEQLLFDIINVYNSPSGNFPEIQLKWRFLRLLDQLLSEICWLQSDHVQHKNDRAKLIQLYLESNIDRHVTLEELSNVYHLDKSYISRIFCECFGISPVRYHQMLRIQKAETMVRYTNISLSSIAEQTGFTSLQDFSRAFRRTEGVSPSELRKSMEKEGI